MIDPFKRRAHRSAKLLTMSKDKRDRLWLKVNKRSLKNLANLGNRTFVYIKAMIESADQIEELRNDRV